MRAYKYICLVLAVTAAAALYPQAGRAAAETDGGRAGYVPGEVLVKFKDGADISGALSGMGMSSDAATRVHSTEQAIARFTGDQRIADRKSGWYSFLGKNYMGAGGSEYEELFQKAYEGMSETERGLYRTYKLTLPDDMAVEQAVTLLENNPDVEYAEPNGIVTACMTPNDPFWSSKGAWGQTYDDLWRLKKIQCGPAWDISQGEGVIVAVIDSGVDYTHRDLAANIWTDSGGKHGYDFINNDSDPMDDYFHGTFCAGIVAAVGNNNYGGLGVAPKAKIMAVKTLDASGNGTVNIAAAGVVWAVDHGAKVLSNSWIYYDGSNTLRNAFAYAHSKACVSVAAAGNENTDMSIFAPANIDTVMAVSASSETDAKCSFSNFGNKIDVSAPGGGTNGEYNIYSTSRGFFQVSAGTSAACPHAAGVAALLLSKYPHLTNTAVREAIRVSADDLGTPGKDIYFGYGRINAQKALAIAGSPVGAPAQMSAVWILARNNREMDHMALSFKDNAYNETGFKVERRFGSESSYREIMSLPANSGYGTVSFTDQGMAPGLYYYRVRAYKNDEYSGYCNEASGTALDRRYGIPRVFINDAPSAAAPGESMTIATHYFNEGDFDIAVSGALIISDTSDGETEPDIHISPVTMRAVYDVAADKLYLKSVKDPNVLIGGFAPGSDNVITNETGALYCKNTTVLTCMSHGDGINKFSAFGSDITWSVSLNSRSGGGKTAVFAVKDIYGAWTKTSPAAITISAKPEIIHTWAGREIFLSTKWTNVYKVSSNGVAVKLCDANADGFMGVNLKDISTDVACVDFGHLGVWQYYNDSWTKILDQDPISMMDAKMTASSSRHIICNLRGYGVQQYNPDTNKSQRLLDFNPVYMCKARAQNAGYDSIVMNLGAEYGGSAVWMYKSNDKSWMSLGCPSPRDMTALDDDADGEDELYMDFGGMGLWRRDFGASTAWTFVAGLDNNSVVLGMSHCNVGYSPKRFVVSVKGSGTWMYDYAKNAWAQLCVPDCYQMSAGDVNGDGADELIMDFGGLGVYKCRVTNNGTYWEKI